MNMHWSLSTSVLPWFSSWLPSQTEALTLRKSLTLATGTTAGVATAWYIWRRYQDRHLPPGPIGLPLVGAIKLVSKDNFEFDLAALSEKYGDVFSIQLGKSLTIILASHSAIKEAFVTHGDIFACRPDANVTRMQYVELHDDIFTTPYQTEGWKENKSFLLKCLRGAGFSNTKTAEDKILYQANVLNSYLESEIKKGKAVTLKDILPKATTNVLFQILFGKSFHYDEAKLADILVIIQDWIDAFNSLIMLDDLPKIIVKTLYRKTTASMLAKSNALRAVLREEVEEHLKTHDPENPADFMDMYIAKKGKEHGVDRMIENAMAFTPDAADTLAVAIEWVLLYITHHPKVQDRMISDIEELTKGNRNVTWADRNSLPYIEAVICEVMRLSAPIAMTAAHAVSKEITFRGYRIPTRAKIFGLLYHVHRNPMLYPEPNLFKPERFIDSDGDLIKTDHWIPFGMGRRKCPGEQISSIELFLFVANLVQNFKFTFPKGENVSLEHSKGAIIKKPCPFKVILTNRS